MSLTRLSEEDVRILELESPTIAGHMCKLMIAERPPAAEPLTLDALRDAVAARLGEAPRLAQKLVPTPLGLANPVWADDPAFDVANHVRRVETGGAVDREGLHRIVAKLMAERLDRSRPLWTLDLVEDLAGGDAALIWRVHHCMADGITAFRLGSQAIWTSGHEAAGDPAEPWHADPEPGALALAALGAHDRLRHMLGGVSALGRTLLRSPWRLRSAASAAARMPAVLARELMPGAAVATFDRHPGAERVVATAEVPLAELKRIEKAFGDGITVNDVVLTAVGGALRRSLASRGESLKDVRAKVPTSLHRQDERDALGNHDSFMFVDLALSDEDPVERLLDINRATRRCKVHRDPQVLYDFFRDVHSLGRPLEHLTSRWAMDPRVFALNVSNVPGPADPVFVLGHRVSAFHSFAEIADRHALRIAVVSVAGTVSFGLCADRAADLEVEAFAAGIEAELAELTAAS